jgi:Protein of unknown function (DUF2735)
MTTPITTTAKIYAFPPRGRFALRTQNGGMSLPAEVTLPVGAEFASRGSSWYHEEALQDSLNEQSRKN